MELHCNKVCPKHYHSHKPSSGWFSKSTTLSLPIDASNSQHNGIIMPAMLIGSLLVFILVVIVYDMQAPKPVQEIVLEPQLEENMILCDSEMAEFQYLMIIRVGSPTIKFNIKRAWIDIEIIGPEGEVLGTPMRYKCALLPDIICGEMHCFIGTIAELPPIKGIRASHNDPSGNIFLYDFVLINVTEEIIVEERIFMESITKKPTIFQGRPAPTGRDAIQQKDVVASLLIEWTRSELLVVFSTLTLTISGLVMVFEYTDAYFAFTNDDGSFYRALLDLLFVTPISLIQLFGIIIPYKYFKKQTVLAECAVENVATSGSSGWQCLSRAFITLLVIQSLAFAGTLVILGGRISLTKSLFWLDASFVVWVIVMGTWSIYEAYLWHDSSQRSAVIVGDSKSMKSSASRHIISQRVPYAIRSGVGETKTVYFTPMSNSRAIKNSACSAMISFGPKLVNLNPLLKNKCKMKNAAKAKQNKHCKQNIFKSNPKSKSKKTRPSRKSISKKSTSAKSRSCKKR